MRITYLTKKFVFSGLILILFIPASGQNFSWVRQIGGMDWEAPNDIALDASGNIYTTGYFEGTVDFDPGIGIYNLTSPAFYSMYISKLNASGNFVWAVMVNSAEGQSIAIDNAGNIYITGTFGPTSDFDPGPGVYNLSELGGADIFICKMDMGGNFIWAKQLSGLDFENGLAMAVDGAGNVFTSGYFYGTTDFNPGAGVFNLTALGQYDAFVSKLDASGNFLWAKQFSGNLMERGSAVAADASGNVIVFGFFEGTTDFDPGIGTYFLTSAGNADVFISKLDASGNLMWVKQMGGTSNDISTDMTLDASGNILSTGHFEAGTADFDPGPGISSMTAGWGWDIFISKLDAVGNFIWAKQISGTAGESTWSIASDNSGNIYTTGDFSGTSDFDPGIGTFNFTALQGSDAFVLKLDALGNFVWADQVTGLNLQAGISVAADVTGCCVYVTGGFKDVTDFDPGPLVFFLTPIGSMFGMNDVFVLKLDNVTILPVELLNFVAYSTQTEVVCNWSTALEINNDFFSVMRSSDGNGFTKIGTIQGAGNSSITKEYGFRDENPLPGISYYYLIQTDFDGKTSSSGIVSVNRNQGGMAYISPNPATDKINIYFDSENNLPVKLSIMDLFGQLIESKTLANSRHFEFDISHLPVGSYFVATERGGTRAINKMIRVKE